MTPEALVELLRRKSITVATAESCTGGLVAAAITGIAGSSDVFDRGFITYSNASKTETLGVPPEPVARFGAVSREIAIAMARGAIAHSRADIAVSVTGIAGPGGGSAEKPVGLVHFGCASRHGRIAHRVHEFGNIGRERVRSESVKVALEMLAEMATAT
jgi:nicotinamide-nucleotide amidase